MPVSKILLCGGTLDGQLNDGGEHPDTLFRIDDVRTNEIYARVDDELSDDGTPIAVFRLDEDGELVRTARRRFAPRTL